MTETNDGTKSNYTQNYYDARGNVLRVYTGLSAPLTINGLDNVVPNGDVDYAVTKYTYDIKGNLISTTDALGNTVSYDVDLANKRIKSTTDKNQNTFVFEYDAIGNVTSKSLADGTNAETTVYGLTGQVLSKTNDTSSISYIYDNKNNRTKTTVPNGETTNYSYNLANMLTSQTTGNKLNEQYTYYLNGNQKTKTSNGETTNYIYDGMNRLVRENNTSYTFDDFGNRLTMSDGTATTAYTYDLNNRLISSTETNNGAVKNTRYSYDYNGNQISKLVTSTKALEQGKGETVKISDKTDENVAFYEYNCYNQVIEADTNGVKSNYAYSPDGLRHSKTVGGNTITFVYDNANVVEEITQDGTNKYYRGFEIVKNDDNVYYLYNGQGDVAMLIDNTGETVANYSFDAYGNQSEENTIYNPFGYRGEYQDNETGLIYLRNRYYDSNNGRFITEDPARDGLNWYVYCNNNPIKYTDPSGTVPVETIIDLASIGWSFSDFVSNPSWANFGFLAWDVAAALVPYAPGSYSAKTIKAGTQILSKSDNYVKSGVWAMKAFDRGYEIEKALGGMANNFPTIDKYVKAQARAGIMWLSSVTSIKSIDITLSSYKSGNTMKNVLKNYVDDLAKFKETIYKGVHYKLDSTGNKILEVAIPPVEMTSNQAKIFQEIKDYATEKGIELITRIIE